LKSGNENTFEKKTNFKKKKKNTKIDDGISVKIGQSPSSNQAKGRFVI